MKKVLTLKLKNETKGAVRYEEPTNDPLYLLGTLYLRKAGLWALGVSGDGDGYPEEITVTIEAAPQEKASPLELPLTPPLS